MEPLRIAHLTDLHVGATRANQWHNRFLSDRPEELAAAAVAAINAAAPDLVVASGDLSDTGSEAELRRARAALDELRAPWIACRGNHDVPPNGDGAAWERVFGDRAPRGVVPRELLPLPVGMLVLALEAAWRVEGEQWRVFLPEEALAEAERAVEAARPEVLLVVCHFPFVRQSAYIRACSPGGTGKNAGTLWEGEAALARLRAGAGTTLALCGHQHFHHVAAGPGWLHITTGALAEYPAEHRLITLDDDGIRLETHCAVPEVISANPPEVTWVRGRPEDRAGQWPLG